MERQVIEPCFHISLNQFRKYILAWGVTGKKNPMGIGLRDQKMELYYENSSVKMLFPVTPERMEIQGRQGLFLFSSPSGGGHIEFHVYRDFPIAVKEAGSDAEGTKECRIVLVVPEDYTTCEVRVNTNALTLEHIFSHYLKDS